MVRSCDGDPAAFRALYAVTAPRLFAYLMSLVHDRVLSEELLQRTFIKVHEACGTFKRGVDPLPWMVTIAHRTCLDELRRRKRARKLLAAEGAHEPRARLDGSSEADLPGYDQATIDRALAALERLPDNQRRAVVLTKIEGASHAMAAKILGTTPGAVKLRAHRGYEALRSRMAAFADEG